MYTDRPRLALVEAHPYHGSTMTAPPTTGVPAIARSFPAFHAAGLALEHAREEGEAEVEVEEFAAATADFLASLVAFVSRSTGTTSVAGAARTLADALACFASLCEGPS